MGVKFELWGWPRTIQRREELALVEDDGRGARGGSCPGKFPDNCHLNSLLQRASMPPYAAYGLHRWWVICKVGGAGAQRCRINEWVEWKVLMCSGGDWSTRSAHPAAVSHQLETTEL